MENQTKEKFFTEKFDNDFCEIKSDKVFGKNVFKRFPRMMPMVGADYEKYSAKILLVLESYYFNENDVRLGSVFLDDKLWYQKEGAVLIPKGSKPDGSEWKVNMHENWIWEQVKGGPFPNIFRAMQSVRPGNFESQCRSIAIYDYFLRPANQGNNGKGFGKGGYCTNNDRQVAYDTFCGIVDVLKPDLIVFLSKFSYETFKKDNKSLDENIVKYVVHPSSAWWNKNGGSYGRENFKNLLFDYWFKPIDPKIKAKTKEIFDEFELNPFWNKEIWGEINYWDGKDTTCAFFDNILQNISIDIYCVENDKYQFQIFEREKFNATKQSGVEWIQNIPNLTAKGFRYESQLLSRQEITEELENLMK